MNQFRVSNIETKDEVPHNFMFLGDAVACAKTMDQNWVVISNGQVVWQPKETTHIFVKKLKEAQNL